MKRVSSLRLWLLLFMIPAIPLGVVWWQINTPFRHVTSAYATDSIGERSALGTLSYYLQNKKTSKIVSISYQTPEADGEYLSEVKRGIRPYQEWVYELEYNRHEKTLTKRLFKGNPAPEKAARIWVWADVTEDVIHQVAAPVRSMKTTFQVAAYKGGNLSELKKYGATLEEPKQETMS